MNIFCDLFFITKKRSLSHESQQQQLIRLAFEGIIQLTLKSVEDPRLLKDYFLENLRCITSSYKSSQQRSILKCYQPLKGKEKKCFLHYPRMCL